MTAAAHPRAMGRARDAILDALENLSGDELKKFKMKLLTVQLREGYGRIPRGALLQMDAIDLTDKLVSYYLESYGLELTMTVLRDMGLQELAEQLQLLKKSLELWQLQPVSLLRVQPEQDTLWTSTGKHSLPGSQKWTECWMLCMAVC